MKPVIKIIIEYNNSWNLIPETRGFNVIIVYELLPNGIICILENITRKPKEFMIEELHYRDFEKQNLSMQYKEAEFILINQWEGYGNNSNRPNRHRY